MNAHELKRLSQELAAGPVPGRHVFLWHGSLEALVGTLHPDLVQLLDVTRLMHAEEHIPTGPGEARKRIEKALRATLRELASQLSLDNRRQILVVTGTELLARYGVGLVPFHEEYVSDRTMVVLAAHRVSGGSSIRESLPDFVLYAPEATHRYMRQLFASEDAVVSDEEEQGS